MSKESISTVEVVGGSSRVPAVTSALADFFGKEPSRTMNAKECVSRGAALQCAMLSPIFRCAPSSGPMPQTLAHVSCAHGLSCESSVQNL